MSAKHTPGPWSRNIKPASRYPVIVAGQNTHVAQVLPGTAASVADGELEANCDLITAAPDLLDALKTIAELLDRTIDSALTVAKGVARAAIAKAEGRTP